MIIKSVSSGRYRYRIKMCLFLFPLLMACIGLSGQAWAEDSLTIRKAEWKAKESKLNVEGRGTAGTIVTIKDATTKTVLGTVNIGRSGRWTYELESPSWIPCRILCELGGLKAEEDVRNAPNDCGQVVPPDVTLLNISIKGPVEVSEETAEQYTATALYSDGSTVDVTNQAAWSVDNVLYANIDNNGLLTTLNVDAGQSLSITAGYSLNGIMSTATLPVIIKNNGTTVTGSHAGRFTAYDGTATCISCHRNEALEVHESVHYQWQGDASETTGLETPNAGKIGGINDFCIYPDINWIGKLTNVDGAEVDGGCAKCHVGLGDKPSSESTQSQLENIDCLICHSDSYKRKVDLVDGKYRFVPDTGKMSVSVLQAAVDITLPSKGSCLNCHSKAGGGNNFKRGDIEEAHRNPTKNFDVHMAAVAGGGAGLNCLDCHTASGHKIAGRGSDLRPRDSFSEVSCNTCHSSTPHEDQQINKHTGRLNCTVCHIPQFAKVAATDMERDWSAPGDFVSESGLYEPHHAKATNVIPTYKFFNGTSYFYEFGDPAVPDENGRIVMSAPNGDIHDPNAKIHAFKHHLGIQPVDPVTERLLPLKIGNFFMTGEIDNAVTQGTTEVGWAYNGHEFAPTERYLGLFHEVAPAEEALSCNSCHNGGTRLDFTTLGYTSNETYNGKPLCASCHEDESNAWPTSEMFNNVHNKHVTQRQFDCSKCHTFSDVNR